MDEQLEFDLPPEDCLIVEDLTDSPRMASRSICPAPWTGIRGLSA